MTRCRSRHYSSRLSYCSVSPVRLVFPFFCINFAKKICKVQKWVYFEWCCEKSDKDLSGSAEEKIEKILIKTFAKNKNDAKLNGVAFERTNGSKQRRPAEAGCVP